MLMNVENKFKTYICPKCKNGITVNQEGNVLLCHKCGNEYKIINDIINFNIVKEYYSSFIIKSEFRKILAEINHNKEIDPSDILFNNLANDESVKLGKLKVHQEQLAWLTLIDLDNKGRVLDFGCGLGFSSLSLSKIFHEVYAVDLAFENLMYIKDQSESKYIDNIKLICGFNTAYLPFKDNFFDVIYLNEFLDSILKNETSKSHFQKKNAQKLYIKYIDEIKRILKPNGHVYMSFENGFSYKNYIQFSTEFLKFIYISYINTVNKNIVNIRYFKKLFHKAGFESLRFYSLIPSIDFISEVIDIEGSPTFLNNLLKLKMNKESIKQSKNFVKNLSQNFGIIAKSQSTISNNSIEIIIKKTNTKLNRSLIPINAKYSISVKGTMNITLIDKYSKEKFITKIALTETAKKSLNQNFNGIKTFVNSKKIKNDIKIYIPKIVEKLSYNIYDCFIEELKQGKPAIVYKNEYKKFEKIVSNSAKIISNYNVLMADYKNNTKIQETIIDQKITHLGNIINFKKEDLFLGRLSYYLKKSLLNKNIPMVFKKGDFSANNILVNKEMNITGIIDWDEYKTKFFPMIDLINLLESFKRHFLNKSLGSIVTDYFLIDKMDKNEHYIISQYCKELKISANLVKPLCIIFWLEQGYLSSSNFDLIKYNSTWMKNNVFKVVEFLGATLFKQ